jgi:hypothetical protein
MNPSTPHIGNPRRKPKVRTRRTSFTVPVACVLVSALAISGFAQSSATPDPETTATEEKIEALERALAEVKAELAQRSIASSTAPAAPAAPTPEPAQAPSADTALATQPEDTELHTLGPLQFRGFSDFTYGRPIFSALPNNNLTSTTNGFSLGDFDLFTTAKIGNHLSMLGELLVTSDFSNEFSAEMDRLMVTYSANDYFRISAGKFNTAIGFYSNEFNRSRFFQTATGRPILFTDEDDGGILPVHSIGLTATGKIPSGQLGLHWVAEIANGRASVSTAALAAGSTIEPIQNFVDENNGKAVNFAVYARPYAWSGFQAGASMYIDQEHPQSLAPLNQRIYSAYAALVKPHLELLAEGVYLRHEFTTNHLEFNTVSGYTQASYLMGRFRPYFRFDYQNVPMADPIFESLGRKDGPSVGVRFNLSDFVGLKVQYGRLGVSLGPTANDAEAQVVYSF